MRITCEECGGRGVDVGSLAEPEECKSCCGAGYRFAPESADVLRRKAIERANRIQNIPYPDFAERDYRRSGGLC